MIGKDWGERIKFCYSSKGKRNCKDEKDKKRNRNEKIKKIVRNEWLKYGYLVKVMRRIENSIEKKNRSSKYKWN